MFLYSQLVCSHVPDHACLNLLFWLDKLVPVIWVLFIFYIVVFSAQYRICQGKLFHRVAISSSWVFTHKNISQLIYLHCEIFLTTEVCCVHVISETHYDRLLSHRALSQAIGPSQQSVDPNYVEPITPPDTAGPTVYQAMALSWLSNYHINTDAGFGNPVSPRSDFSYGSSWREC